MEIQKRLLRIFALLILAPLVIILITPFAVSSGIRFWLSWEARQQNFNLKIDKISAPLLRPVVMRGIRITSAPANAFSLDVKAAEATIELNLVNIFRHGSGRIIRALSIEGLQAETHRDHPGSFLSASGWMALQRILPKAVRLPTFDLRLEDGPTVILVRKAALSASEIESGQFRAGEITIVSPLFRQTFNQLRGSTNWQNKRLTIAGLNLARGLDLEWISINLSSLGKERVDVDLDADAAGGKIRASITDDWREENSTWNLVGWASDISLAATSDVLGFTDRINGLLHAGKITFRGDPRHPTDATASLWMELTDLQWRNRAAEVIMLGASLYNRQIEIQQLYVRQSKNQLTLSGQAAFPAKPSDWLSPEFRGDISASINQLGDFAALFGTDPGDFEGAIGVEGTVNTRDRKIGGHIRFNGTSLTLFRTAIDSLQASLNLKGGEMEIEQLEATRNHDLLRANGKIDMLHEHNYSGSVAVTVNDLADYLSIFCGPDESRTKPTPATIDAKIESSRWDVHGTINLPGSSPFDFTANFLLPIGTDWKRFQTTSIALTLDFPSIFLANVPQIFHPQIFRDGILSGKISLTETLQHPRIDGEVQLIDGKLENAALNLVQASAGVTFHDKQASIDFFHGATKDVDLAVSGQIDLHDTNDFVITLSPATSIFDLTTQRLECLSKLDIQPIAVTLAPAVAKFEIRGGLNRPWKINVQETASQNSVLPINQIPQGIPLCLGRSPEEKTFTIGAPPRPQPKEPEHRKKRARRR